MTETQISSGEHPHVAVFPSAGMGHLTPHLRLAAMLASRGCKVTIITAEPPVSAAETASLSTFFSAHPQIKRLHFEILPREGDPKTTTTDPFFLQWEAIHNSAQRLLRPLLSSLSPPITALFSDITSLAATFPVTDELGVSNYVVSTTSARFFSFIANLPAFNPEDSVFNIPGLAPFSPSVIPPPFFIPKNPFASMALENARFFPKSTGVLMNTFDKFEPETINNGRLPTVYSIGPLKPYRVELRTENSDPFIQWLKTEAVGSVVFVSFGSRTAMSKEQIRELATGLERSGCPFLWVLKSTKVDKEDKDDISELLGDSFLERTRGSGVVARGWVDQQEILAHPAVGGFLSHCGWNSVMEAARAGVPILAWPLGGDQRVNAEVVEKGGLGRVLGDWGWGGERLVSGEEIGVRVREMMGDKEFVGGAKEVGEEARKAWEAEGSSELALRNVIDTLKNH